MDIDRAAHFTEALGKPLEEATFRELFATMTGQYARERVEEAVALEEDGDMLLFQWGDYDGKATIDITRQLILPNGAMFQLSASVESLPAIGSEGRRSLVCHARRAPRAHHLRREQ